MPARYEVIEPLATGGMGELELARLHTELGVSRLVVTKRLRTHLTEDPRARVMLLDEARIAATLYHDNIVQVLDLVIEDDAIVLVLEYFPCVNLAQLLDACATPLPVGFAAAIVEDAAAALHYAHERCDDEGVSLGIVHRDVSLPNLLLGDHGHVKLTDFGVAKARSRMYRTRSESIKGKLGYMAPEQIRGLEVDRRVDVFALGVVLFELATQTPMFTADSDYETMRRVLEADLPDPRELVPDVPPELASIIARATARDRDARLPTAAALGDELAALRAARGWLVSPADLAALVARHVPAGVPAWRRARALGGA